MRAAIVRAHRVNGDICSHDPEAALCSQTVLRSIDSIAHWDVSARAKVWTVVAADDRRSSSWPAPLPLLLRLLCRLAPYRVPRVRSVTSRYSGHAGEPAGTVRLRHPVGLPAEAQLRAIGELDSTSKAAPCKGASPATPPLVRNSQLQLWYRLAPGRSDPGSRSVQASARPALERRMSSKEKNPRCARASRWHSPPPRKQRNRRATPARRRARSATWP